ncbi:MAG: prepilin-type N-terminal cleavage/methylation domain-containing protein [Defluviitaleaceae bacterium]|nr:prepilin-type N-terminal cleavage/methylation domain-containing protein [Defluviitaleaceae bacterium]MCL2238696.1 prepilin-type N-terminal cleavage/methylation domain-containing protein [Defluviitaleaceae bacterium]
MEIKSRGGFTLMELTIVLAILAIIAAILIPTFLNTTDRARLRSDISSARVIHNAMELYRAERGRVAQGATMAAVLDHLRITGFLEARHTDIQTAGAIWETHAQQGVVVNISASGDGVHRAFNGLPPEEQAYITGGRVSGATPLGTP